MEKKNEKKAIVFREKSDVIFWIFVSTKMIFQVIFFCLLHLITVSEAETTFPQYNSARYYYENAKPPIVAAFPLLQIEPILMMVTNKNKTFILSDDGIISMLYNGTLSNFAMVGYTADSALAVSTDGIVVCTSKNCIWYKCDEETCVPINTHTSDLGPIVAMAVQSDNSVWVGGKNSGLLHLSATGTIINVVKVIGNITAIAVGTTDVAVGTTDAVYYQFDPTQKMFTKWVQANGASMDGHPTALAFLKEELWIGGEWCLNVVRKDGFTVDRVAGNQGLPVGNITSLDTDDAGSLWIGTEQGLAMMSPMSSVPEKYLA